MEHQSVAPDNFLLFFLLLLLFPPFDEDMTNDNVGFSAWCSPGGTSAGQKMYNERNTEKEKKNEKNKSIGSLSSSGPP